MIKLFVCWLWWWRVSLYSSRLVTFSGVTLWNWFAPKQGHLDCWPSKEIIGLIKVIVEWKMASDEWGARGKSSLELMRALRGGKFSRVVLPSGAKMIYHMQHMLPRRSQAQTLAGAPQKTSRVHDDALLFEDVQPGASPLPRRFPKNPDVIRLRLDKPETGYFFIRWIISYIQCLNQQLLRKTLFAKKK